MVRNTNLVYSRKTMFYTVFRDILVFLHCIQATIIFQTDGSQKLLADNTFVMLFRQKYHVKFTLKVGLLTLNSFLSILKIV